MDCSNCPLDTWLDVIVKVESSPEAEFSPDARKTKTDDKVALVEEVIVVKAVQEKDAARLDYGKENLLAEVSPEIKDERLEVEVGSAKEHADKGERLVTETRAEAFRKYMEELDRFSDCNRKSLVEVRKSMEFRRQESIVKVVPVEVVKEETVTEARLGAETNVKVVTIKEATTEKTVLIDDGLVDLERELLKIDRAGAMRCSLQYVKMHVVT